MPQKLSAEQLEEATRLQRRLWTHQRIADELGVRRETVSRALARINKRAHSLLEKAIAAEKGRQLERLDWIADEAIQGWQRSKVTTIEPPKLATPLPPGVEPPKAVKVKRDGNPRFLREARAALTDARALLGLNAPATKPAEPKPTDDDFEVDLSDGPTPQADHPPQSGHRPAT